MKVGVGQKVFWTVLIVSSLIVGTVMLVTSFSIRRCLARYLASAQLS